MNNEESEKEILTLLEDGEKSTTEISSFISRNYYDTLEILDKLLTSKKIEKIEIGKFTFWRKKRWSLKTK
ncbi:MAG: hypothetical protein ACTSXD_07060 [Candidatus Heimdallarchaeaceae archaeon]